MSMNGNMVLYQGQLDTRFGDGYGDGDGYGYSGGYGYGYGYSAESDNGMETVT